jgi:hypothetical protein
MQYATEELNMPTGISYIPPATDLPVVYCLNILAAYCRSREVMEKHESLMRFKATRGEI